MRAFAAIVLSLGGTAACAGQIARPEMRPSAAEEAALTYLGAHLAEARDMSDRCDPQPLMEWPNYVRRPVQRCAYDYTSNGKTLSAIVYLLNPTARNIALRVGGACAAIGLGASPVCGTNLAHLIICRNGAQFPVAGFVVERRSEAGGTGPDPVYLEFRDGNTVQTTDRLNFTDRQLSLEAMEHAARAPVAETRNVARIANAYRSDYRRAGGTEPVGDDWHGDRENRWPSVIRANELRAQATGEDLLLVGVAMGMRGKLVEEPRTDSCEE